MSVKSNVIVPVGKSRTLNLLVPVNVCKLFFRLTEIVGMIDKLPIREGGKVGHTQVNPHIFISR